jgi:hypothetical protein
MAEKFEVLEKCCPKGHIIPVNGAVVGHDHGYPIVLQTSRLICEQCAIEASFGETLEGMRHHPVRGKRLEKLGQESFLQKVPAKFIS